MMTQSNSKIYCVDDDADVRTSIERLLDSAGFRVETFASAEIFIDSVPVQYETGVLILDLRMPGMDGFALQKKMNEYGSQLKIIVITADVQRGDRDRAIQSGAIGFLQKPFQDESLFDLIRRALEKSDSEEA